MRNDHKYTWARLLHISSGVGLGLIFLFLPRKNNRIIFNSTLNQFYNFNSKYLFEYFLDQPGWECRFVIDSPSLREKLNKTIGPYFISSKGVINKAYILRAGAWVSSSLETPVGGVWLSLRRLVYHVGHGIPVKAAGLADPTAPWYKKWYYALVRTNFSYFLAPSEKASHFVQKTFGCKREKIAIHGQPRLSPLFQAKAKSPHKGLSILYAPTWRKDGPTKIFPFSDYDKEALEAFLSASDVKISLRLHPYYENSSYVSKFLSERVRPLSTEEAPEIMDVLADFDVVITDYSSIYLDFIVLNRPVMFFPYDLSEYEQQTSFVTPYKELTPGPHIFSQTAFIAELEQLLAGEDNFFEGRSRLNNLLNGTEREPCLKNYKFIDSIVNKRI